MSIKKYFRFNSLIFFIIVICIFIFIWAYFTEPEVFTSDNIMSKYPRTALPVVIAALTLMFGILIPRLIRFLNYEVEIKSQVKMSKEDLDLLIQQALARSERIRDELNIDTREKVNEYIKSNLTVKEVEESIYNRTIENLEGQVIKKLRDDFNKSRETKIIQENIFIILDRLESSIEQYITRLQRNSSVNLIIGIGGTFTAITILSISLLTDKVFLDFLSFFIHFLPRFVFVVSIQIFAFFFLRLYKNNLDDAKYFQNELTNIACKTSALKIANLLNIPERASDVLEKLSIVERNFKIGKEDTLLAIEKAKIERDIDLNILASYKEFFSTFKKENGKPNV